MTSLIPLLLMSPAPRSTYPLRLEDKKAVYLQAKGDGVADDSDAIQAAIDRVQETTGQGIVFVPEGRYRLTKTLAVWPGIRLIGYGSNRPVFTLADQTPGFDRVERLMVFFAGRRAPGAGGVPESAGTAGGDFEVSGDANPGTFYSALSNIDFEIGEGNPAAVGIRARYAQHCYISHADFRLKSGLAAIHDIGNWGEDLRFFGGDYGIITRTPSPGWQFTLMDGYFEGQRKAAIRTRVTGLTLVRPRFRSVPTAVSVDPEHSEQLWLKDGVFEDISGPAIEISRERSLRTQINVENAVCRNVATFARLRESGRTLLGKGRTYRVDELSHGLQYASLNATPKVNTIYRASEADALREPASDVPPMPPMETWINVRDLGAKGDGEADDTAVLQDAIAKHRTLYFPTGKYRVTDPLLLRPDTVLIGLNPITTQIVVADGTPAFGVKEGRTGPMFAGSPVALIEAPRGGTNIVTGLGLDTGGDNPSAVAALWRAGAGSMMDDVKFIGGHGSGVPIYNNTNSGDPNPARRWDSQYPSLWVTDGGGGTFKNLWTASTFAAAGMRVTDTKTPGRVYQMSSEHHVRYEVQMRNCANWDLIALQTEEERGESPFALPLEIDRCENITVANLNMYRVVSVTQPFPYAVRVSDSRNIRFRGLHCYSNSKVSFDNAIFDATASAELRQREFARLDHTSSAVGPVSRGGPKVERLATGFFNISGGAVAPNGDFYFVDAKWHRIYRWDVAAHRATVVADDALFPTNLAFDTMGNLVVLSYAGKGKAYWFRPETGHEPEIRTLPIVEASDRPGATPFLPVTDWILSQRNFVKPRHIVSPDGKTFIPVGQDFEDGALTWGVKLQDVLRSFGLAPATPGKPFYATSESDMRTYRFDVDARGNLVNPVLFAEQGGEGVTTDDAGNVYIAAGQIYVYSPDGKLRGTIHVPERPTQLLFGGVDRKTLFITARTSLYAVRIS